MPKSVRLRADGPGYGEQIFRPVSPRRSVRRLNQLDGFGPVSNTYWRKERALQREHEAQFRAMGQWTDGEDEA